MDRIHLYKFLFLCPTLAFALPQATSSDSSTTASQTQPSFPTMSAQDGVGVPDGGVGSTATPSMPGANGADQGAFSLSTGAIVGISVAIGVLVIAIGKTTLQSAFIERNLTISSIGVMWFLWYMAKKRQWNIRESIRRASRRMTGRKVPPKSAPASKNRRGTVYIKPTPSAKGYSRTQDTERGLSSIDETAKLPTHGWLADEKERSRSRSREDDERIQIPAATAGGWKAKVGGR